MFNNLQKWALSKNGISYFLEKFIKTKSSSQCSIEDLHKIVQKNGYNTITQLTDRYYLVSKKRWFSILENSEDWLYGVIDAQNYWEEIFPCKYSYVNPYLPENNGIIQVFSDHTEWFIDLSIDTPKEYHGYPGKKRNEKGTFFRNWQTNISTGFSQFNEQEISDLIKTHTTHDTFFKDLCQKVSPCNNDSCHHWVNDLRILDEKYDRNTPRYYIMQIWRCSKCGGILRFLWDEVGSCENDYGSWSVTTSGDPYMNFDPKWDSKDIIEDLIIKEYIPEEVTNILYSGEELWNKNHSSTH